jgi:hypothetical protein
VSVSSLQLNGWVPPLLPQSSNVASQGSAFASIAEGIAQSSSNTPTSAGVSPAGQTNPFQQLATDVQAVLAQGPSSSTAAAASAATSDPTQQLVTDLQSIYAQMQATQSGGDPGSPTPATGQAGASEPHHHHHHDAGGAPDSGTTSASPNAASGNMQNVAQTLSAEMMQALQAYASSSSATAVTQLSV